MFKKWQLAFIVMQFGQLYSADTALVKADTTVTEAFTTLSFAKVMAKAVAEADAVKTRMEFKTIKKPLHAERFAGLMVMYSLNDGLPGDELPESVHSYAQNKDGVIYYFGFVLSRPTQGKEAFYRLIPVIKNNVRLSEGFVRDLDSLFLKKYPSMKMRILRKSEYKKLEFFLKENGARFDYCNSAYRAGLSEEYLKRKIEDCFFENW